jgi:aminoglycoside N3'-acetyltransferase
VPLNDCHVAGTVLDRFKARGATLLRLGANPDMATLTHYAESLADAPDKIRVRRRYVRADRGGNWIESLDHTDSIAIWHEGDHVRQVYRDYRASGAVRIGSVERCEAELFDAQPFVRFAVDWLNRHLGPRAAG